MPKFLRYCLSRAKVIIGGECAFRTFSMYWDEKKKKKLCWMKSFIYLCQNLKNFLCGNGLYTDIITCVAIEWLSIITDYYSINTRLILTRMCCTINSSISLNTSLHWLRTTVCKARITIAVVVASSVTRSCTIPFVCGLLHLNSRCSAHCKKWWTSSYQKTPSSSQRCTQAYG